MENKTAGKSSWAFAFTIASMWFGTHVGAGFATGNQVVGYFSKYGPYAAIFPILAMGILALCMYAYMKYAHFAGTTNYKDTFKSVYPSPWMEIFFEVFYIIIILAAVAGCITGAAQIMAKMVGETQYGAVTSITWTYNLIATVCLILLCIFGLNLIRIVSTGLTVAIIITAIIVVIVGLVNLGTVDTMLATYPELQLANYTDGLNCGFLDMSPWRGIIIYAAFQCVSLPSMIAGSAELDLKGIKRACILGWIMNGFILAASAFMLSKWYPLLAGMDALGADFYGQFHLGGVPTAIPNMTILTLTGMKALSWAYNILLFCAFVSTSITLVFSMIDRFSPKFFPSVIDSEKVRGFLVGLVVLGLCLMIAPMGLSAITTKLYGYDGYLAVLVIFIPAIIWALPKTKKLMEAKKD